MFENTQPAELDAAGDIDAWAPFRVGAAGERLRLLRGLCERSVPVTLGGPSGVSVTTALWSLDAAQDRLVFGAHAAMPQLPRLLECDEVVAVAYDDSVKLQFDLDALVLVRGPNSCALQCAMPRAIYRFQRRNAYRVRTPEHPVPLAQFRHPAQPESVLALRILDVSIGGCALWLPDGVPPLQAGTPLGEVHFELDAETRFVAAATLRHVSVLGRGAAVGPGKRVGCQWRLLAGQAERALQRWIDQAQRRRRLLGLV